MYCLVYNVCLLLCVLAATLTIVNTYKPLVTVVQVLFNEGWRRPSGQDTRFHHRCGFDPGPL